jgi:ElaB/YqjD/DUF883 family membrane-anchored ribosome-binding protein
MDATTTSNEKIVEALKLLNEAAREKKAEMGDVISDKYHHLKQAIIDSEKAMGGAAAAAKDYSVKKAKEVDENVHDHPWPWIGGAALVGVLLGYILGHKNHDR